LPSPRRARAWLLAKEWREIVASRAFWLMLLLTGPLVGTTFISAVDTYAELSGLHGTAGGVGEAFSPLIGVWAPTFSAYELVAVFLLPFVAIRLVSGDRQSGALALEHQGPHSALARIVVKAVVLLAAWLIASTGALFALLLWKSYGGAVYLPEIASAALGHLLNAALTIALAAAAAAIADHPATAAILTLGFTIGTWLVSFAAALHGGVWERLAGYTPPVMIGWFQHGLVRVDAVLIVLALVAAGLALAAVWTHLGAAPARRAGQACAIAAAAGLAVLAGSSAHASFDLSESRYSSFARSDESQLRHIAEPLRMEVHLAPEDPRRFDLERQALGKLRRVLPELSVRYVSATSTGLFEQGDDDYGEIRYEMAGRTAVSRMTSAEGVLETIYELADLDPPPEGADDVFRGHPLAVPPKGAAAVFYGLWPAVVLAGSFFSLRRRT
jgi:hypothetical protein